MPSLRRGLAFFCRYTDGPSEPSSVSGTSPCTSPSASSSAEQLPAYSLYINEGGQPLSEEQQNRILRKAEKEERKRQQVLFVDNKIAHSMQSYGW